MRRSGLRAGRAVVIPALAAALVLIGATALARPYDVEDLIRQESFGEAAFDPTGRWLVYERRLARTQAATLAILTRPEVVVNQLRVADVRGGGPARPLIAGDPVGVTLGPFSPDGRRVAVYGYRDGRWILGVVDLAGRRVRWLGIDAEFPYRSRTVQWRSPTDLVAIARPAGSLPLILGINSVGPRLLPDRWRRAHRGEAVMTAIGSGRWFGVRPRKPPSRLLLIDVARGSVVTLATGDIEDLEIAPGGGHVAFTEAGPDVRLRAAEPVHGPNGTAERHRRLGLVDLASRQVLRPGPDRDLAGQLLSWSPSGRRLLVFARRDREPWTSGALLQVTPEGAVTALPLGDRSPVLRWRPEAVRAAWLGETPALLTRKEGRADWVALGPDGPRVLTQHLPRAPDHLVPTPAGVIGLAAGGAWRLTPKGAARLPAPEGVTAAPARLLWEVRLASNPPAPVPALPVQRPGPGGVHVSVIGAPGRGPEGVGAEVMLPGCDSRVLAATARGDALAAIDADPHGVVRLHLWSGARWRRLDAVNSHQRDVDPLRAVAVRDPAAAGPSGVSWLYLPARPPGAPPPPLVVIPYPGIARSRPSTLADYGDRARTPSVPAIVGAGYAVLDPALPLAADAEPASDLGERVLALVDAAAAQHPGAFDPTRLGIWGHSFGGYGALAVISQTDRFRAAIAMAPPTDLASGWGAFPAAQRIDPSEGLGISGRTGWTEDAQGAMRAPPWRAPDRYRRNSPVYQADRISTPLLVLAGDQDHIPPGQAEAIFAALYRQDRDAMLVTYWGEAHILYGPGNVRDAYGRSLAWLVETLGRPLSPSGSPPARPPSASARPAPSSR